MSRSVSRVVRRGGMFYFRMAMPRAHLGSVGLAELKTSLRTSDPIEARVRGRLLSNALDVWFQGINRMAHLPPEIIQNRLRDYFQTCLNRSLEYAYLLPTDPASDIEAEIAYLCRQAEALRAQLTAQSFAATVVADAKTLLAGDALQSDLDHLQHVCNGVLRAKLENARILAAMLSGEYAATAPRDPLFSGMTATGLPPLPGEIIAAPAPTQTLSSIATLFYAAKTKHDWVGKTARDVRRVLDLAQAVIGEKPIRSLAVEHVRAVRDALAKLPPNYSKISANKGITVAGAIEANASGQALSRKTQDKYLTMFKQLLIWAEHEGYIEKVPGAGVKVAGVGKTNPAEQRNPYSNEQLSAIFRSPLYTGHAAASRHVPGPQIVRDGKFWVPLIALFSGMRMGEIVQLRVSDVKQEQSIWFFDISKGEDKKLKTASSKRRVPVHRVLLDLGLLELTGLSKEKQRIFSDIEPGMDGYFSHNFSKWWGRYSRHVGFHGPKTAFHSFRHNFTDALRAAELPDYVNKSLVGHVDKSVHSQYGSGPALALLKSSVDKVSYGIDVGWLML